MQVQKYLYQARKRKMHKYNPNSEKQKNQGIDFQVTTGSPVCRYFNKVALITDNTKTLKNYLD